MKVLVNEPPKDLSICPLLACYENSNVGIGGASIKHLGDLIKKLFAFQQLTTSRDKHNNLSEQKPQT